MAYREPTKPKTPPKKLLYKKPWWKLWNRKEVFRFNDGDRYVWNWIRRWKYCKQDRSYEPKIKSTLWYTTEGNWVFKGTAYKFIHSGPSRRKSDKLYTWVLYSDTLDRLKEKIKSKHDASSEFYSGFREIEALIEKENAPPPTTTRI